MKALQNSNDLLQSTKAKLIKCQSWYWA